MESIDLLIKRYPALSNCRNTLETAVAQLVFCYQQGGKLLVCGNGGSCSDAAHIVGEMMKSFCLPRKLTPAQTQALSTVHPMGTQMAQQLQQGFSTIDLSAQISLNTAISNDVNPSLCFAQQAFVYAQPCDVLLGISTSGQSENILKAGVAAKSKGAYTIGFTGQATCRMDTVFDLVVHAPAIETYQVQEYHLPMYHALCLDVEQALFSQE
ncbi:MAG: SIS domain-containing protein [Ruthenibacterium sp.]